MHTTFSLCKYYIYYLNLKGPRHHFVTLIEMSIPYGNGTSCFVSKHLVKFRFRGHSDLEIIQV